MNWITISMSGTPAACVTLAVVNFSVWCRQRTARSCLFFTSRRADGHLDVILRIENDEGDYHEAIRHGIALASRPVIPAPRFVPWLQAVSFE